VPYGKAIYHCKVPGTVALTFDDGPWEYTEELLNLLDVSVRVLPNLDKEY
jgi:peptidoglycan/xylan/chitin deacetylase (PgdA/CDA1 family)